MGGRSVAYRLGDWVIRPALNQASRGDARVRMPPKAMDVLACLLERAGEVVSAAEIIEHAWPGRVVEESSVYQRISQIRRALDDDPVGATYIERIPRRGYRISAPVAALEGGSEARQRESSPSNRRRKLVAVLPLRDLTPAGAYAWLAEGLTEQLRLQIGAWHRFSALPGTLLRGCSIDNLPEGVDYLIDGYLQVEDEQVHIGLDVVEVLDRRSLWSKTFSGRLGEQLEVQRRIATQIAHMFSVSLSFFPCPTHPDALEPFLRFITVWSYGSYDDTHYWLEQTLNRDPDWSWGWAELAGLLLREGSVLTDRSHVQQARSILQRLEQQPEQGAHQIIMSSWLRAYWEGDLSGAEQMLRPLAEKGLIWPYGMLMLTSGLHEEAEHCFRRLTEQRPYLNVGWEMLMWAQLNLGDGPGAIAAGRQLVRLYPEDAVNSASLLCHAMAYAGDLGDALTARADLEERFEPLKDGPQRCLTQASRARIDFVLSIRRDHTAGALEAARRMADLGRHAEACVMFQRTGRSREASEQLQEIDPDLERFWWWTVTAYIPPDCETTRIVCQLREKLGFTDTWRDELRTRAASLSLTGQR